MCGIAGLLTRSSNLDIALLRAMVEQLHHRGPDAEGTWMDPTAGIALGHRRLSIIDLSAHGSQPMVSQSGRYVVSYNGEIYNYRALREELTRKFLKSWQSHSDTEVLLTAIEQWGVAAALERLNGMFAFALWDRRERTLTLARDRLGEKPLYVAWADNNVYFASELKSFRAIPHWRPALNSHAIGHFLRFGYVPSPLSIYQNVYKLPPASMVDIDSGNLRPPSQADEFLARCRRYWDLSKAAGSPLSETDSSDGAVLDQLAELLTDSVKLRMDADVPVGAMLSGGVDSSLVAAIMQSVSSRPIQTFTVGFDEGNFDEARYAKPVANHLGSEHTEVHLRGRDALDLVASLPNIYDEPFADPSQIPTFLISKVARRKVTVALSGDGGDELFFGYGRYRAAHRTWRLLRWCSPAMRRTLARFSKNTGQWLQRANTHYSWERSLAHRMQRLGRRMSASDFDSYYSNLISLSLYKTSASSWPAEHPIFLTKDAVPGSMGIARRMMFFDQMTYLPDDILVKTDRASMNASLELRVPLLDHRIVEFSWQLPERLLGNGRTGKKLLREILHRYIPKELVDRPKKGFEIPLEEWLRGPLREWMLDLLSSKRIAEEPYLDSSLVQRLAQEHAAGTADHGYALWPVLMLQSWLDEHHP